MIINGEIPSKIVYQDEDVVVFPDINPVTTVHLLIVKEAYPFPGPDGGR